MLADGGCLNDSRSDYETRGNGLAMVATQSGLLTGSDTYMHIYPQRSHVRRSNNKQAPA